MSGNELKPSSVMAFKEALNGSKGELDAWLECNNEDEVRAHINALLSEQRQASVSCVACEGRPSGDNVPCAVCGQPQASAGSCVCGEPESPGIHRKDAQCYANLPQVRAAQSAPVVPEGWRVERRELDGSICFIIGSPRIAGVRSNNSVWESDSDPAHLLLWHMLSAAPAQPAAHDQGEVQRLRKALEHARLFIRNGIDLGYIRMPDADTPDPAHETLPMIDAALAASTGQGVK